MLVSPTALAGTTEPVDDPTIQPASASVEAPSTEVLITTEQVLFSTAAAVRMPRESTGDRLVGFLRRIFAASTEPARPRSQYTPKRYAYIENAAMARAMEKL